MRNWVDRKYMEEMMSEHACGDEIDFEMASKMLKKDEPKSPMDEWLDQQDKWRDGMRKRWDALDKTRKTVRDRLQIALDEAIHDCREILRVGPLQEMKPDTGIPWPPWRVAKVLDWPPKWREVHFKGLHPAESMTG